MPRKHPRMTRETKTIRAMVRLYCNDHHATKDDVCPECSAFIEYALLRLEKCPFQEGKTTCAKCPVHCYKPDMREKVRKIMRYSGPRMVRTHPVLAAFHLLDGRRKAPVRLKNRTVK